MLEIFAPRLLLVVRETVSKFWATQLLVFYNRLVLRHIIKTYNFHDPKVLDHFPRDDQTHRPKYAQEVVIRTAYLWIVCLISTNGQKLAKLHGFEDSKKMWYETSTEITTVSRHVVNTLRIP